MVKRFAVINDTTQIVENVVAWDEQAEWSPPAGHTLRELAASENPHPTLSVFNPDDGSYSQQSAATWIEPEFDAESALVALLDTLESKALIGSADRHVIEASLRRS